MSDVIELKYATWMTVGIRLGIALFFATAMFFFYLAFQAINQGSIFACVLMALFGAYMFYLAMHGTKLLPYLGCAIRADDNGFQIVRNDQIESYSWSQPLILRNSVNSQILEIFDSSDNRILAIDHEIENFDAFHQRLKRS